jgi:hypothetical protein
MPRSRVRDGRKKHNKRIRHFKLMKNHQVLAISALKQKIWDEAKERYEKEKLEAETNPNSIQIVTK